MFFVPCSLIPVSLMSTDQIQQREQEDPDNIDKVPVQAEVLDKGDVPVHVRRRASPSQIMHASSAMPIIMCSACMPVIAKYSEK